VGILISVRSLQGSEKDIDMPP